MRVDALCPTVDTYTIRHARVSVLKYDIEINSMAINREETPVMDHHQGHYVKKWRQIIKHKVITHVTQSWGTAQPIFPHRTLQSHHYVLNGSEHVDPTEH